MKASKVRKALIPAAGLGTRFLPATKVVPKELLPIVDRPSIEYIVEELADSGIEEVVFVISREKEAVFDHFQSGTDIELILEQRGQADRLERLSSLMKRVKFHKAYQDNPKGLGHAVWCGREVIGNEPFVVVLPDDLVRSKTPCVKQLIDVYKREGRPVVAVENVAPDRVKFYGIVDGSSPDGKTAFAVRGVVEKPEVGKAPSNWAIIGRYLLDPSVFDAISKLKPGAIGEIQLTDGLAKLIQTTGLMAHPFEGTRIDAGQPHGWLEANLWFGLDRADIRAHLEPVIQKLAKE
jgi:UTP--glucose-1-phosphate uridylyltransferase